PHGLDLASSTFSAFYAVKRASRVEAQAASVTFSPAQAGVAANSLIHNVLHIILCAFCAEDFT
ncbi:MAG: hypothetical protein IJ714_07325, partial [Bacteroidales bacterium]|nr:hypothetical protein [Bacteroidales bacterium]